MKITEVNFMKKQTSVILLFIMILLPAAIYAQVAVTLPVINSQSVGGEEYYSVTVGNLTGKNVTAFQFSLYYDKNVVLINDATTLGLMTSGGQISFFADTLNGVINCAWASALPLSGTGGIANLKFKYLQTGFSTLTCINPGNSNNTFFFNNGTPIAAVNNGSVNITGLTYSISGKVTYDNNALSPVQNVVVNIIGPNNFQASSMTTVTGNYSFNSLVPGEYSISFSKTGDYRGVNSTDALMAVRRFVLGTDLNDMQLLAADVNNDNNINSTDALLILKRFTGTVASFIKPDWIIAPAGINITIVNGNVVKNSSCIAAGDIDRSWTP